MERKDTQMYRRGTMSKFRRSPLLPPTIETNPLMRPRIQIRYVTSFRSRIQFRI